VGLPHSHRVKKKKCFQKLNKWQKQRNATVKCAGAIDTKTGIPNTISFRFTEFEWNPQVATTDRFHCITIYSLIYRQDETFRGVAKVILRGVLLSIPYHRNES
jgi:hypothetical protein